MAPNFYHPRLIFVSICDKIHNIKISPNFLKLIKLSHVQSCSKRKLQIARAQTLLLNLRKWFFVLLDLYKTMTFLEKIMVMDFDNGLNILTGSKNIGFTTNV